jgi:hypothetical protein
MPSSANNPDSEYFVNFDKCYKVLSDEKLSMETDGNKGEIFQNNHWIRFRKCVLRPS